MSEVENIRSCEKCGNALLEGEKTCARCKEDQGKVEFNNRKRTGNSAGNILNGGNAVLHGDWIYFCGSNSDSQLQRIKCDGSQREIIGLENTSFLNSVGDWIYYSSDNDQSRVFKVRADGTERTQVNDDTSKFYNYLSVVDNWLYYTSGDREEQKICKMRLDGSERTELYQSENELVYRMGVAGEWIFYSTIEKKKRENRKIYKLHSVSKERITLVDHSSGEFTLDNEWLYCDGEEYLWLIKIPVDSSDDSKSSNFINGYISAITASEEDGWVYFAKRREKMVSPRAAKLADCAIYRVKPDGTEETRILKAPAYNLLIVGDWILFDVYNASEDVRLCMVRKDGTNRQFII
jgi:hypothetical protein